MTVAHQPGATERQPADHEPRMPQRRRDQPRSSDEARKKQQRHAVQLYQSGSSIRAIARELGRSYGYARTLLLDAGVELRASGRQPRTAPT